MGPVEVAVDNSAEQALAQVAVQLVLLPIVFS